MAITADTLVAIAVVDERSSTTNTAEDESRYGMTGKSDYWHCQSY